MLLISLELLKLWIFLLHQSLKLLLSLLVLFLHLLHHSSDSFSLSLFHFSDLPAHVLPGFGIVLLFSHDCLSCGSHNGLRRTGLLFSLLSILLRSLLMFLMKLLRATLIRLLICLTTKAGSKALVCANCGTKQSILISYVDCIVVVDVARILLQNVSLIYPWTTSLTRCDRGCSGPTNLIVLFCFAHSLFFSQLLHIIVFLLFAAVKKLSHI